MIIKDPQNLLSDLKINISNFSDRILEIPPHNIPLHPHSIQKLLMAAREKSAIIVFQPTLPILSDLGLPSYPTLAYSYSQELSDTWYKIQPYIEALLTSKTLQSQPLPFPLILLSEIDKDEQLHYFSFHYGKAITPSYVRVVISNTCNLKCVMCPYHSLSIKSSHATDFFQKKKAMSWEMMEKLALDCGKAGIAILIGSVEEPLLHPKLIDFIQLCRQQGVPKVHLTTNGQLLNKTYIRNLLQSGLTSIDISIDAGTPETYLRIRGSDLNRVEANIINFLKLRDQLGISCNVRTSFVRNREVSIEEEQIFLNRWLSQVNSVLVLNVAEYKQANMHLNKTNNAVNNSLQYYQKKAKGRWACLFPFLEMAVLPDGQVFYCIETLFRLGFDQEIESLGDYTQENLLEIWSGKLFQQLRQDLILNQLKRRKICQNCEMWKSQITHQELKNGYSVLTTTVTEIYSQI